MVISTHCSFVNVEVSIEESSIITLEAAELIGTATAEKDGLMSAKDYKNNLQRKTFSNNVNYKIGNIEYIFSGFFLIGVETAHCEFVNICISKNNTKLMCSNKPDYVKIKADSDGNIYLSVMMGWSVYGLLIGSGTTIVTQSPPSDAVDVEVVE